MPFQQSVKTRFAPAVAGDFASANPRASMLAGPNSLVAAAAGVTIGLFAWAITNGLPDLQSGETDLYDTVSNAGSGVPSGFVSRTGQGALISTFLAESGSVIPQGSMVTLMVSGDYWVRNNGASAVAAGHKVYVSTLTGQVQTAATGTALTGVLLNHVETKWFAMSAALAGELFKMSSYPLG